MSKTQKKDKFEGTKDCNLRHVPIELWTALKVKSLKEGITVRDAVIQALKDYVDIK